MPNPNSAPAPSNNPEQNQNQGEIEKNKEQILQEKLGNVAITAMELDSQSIDSAAAEAAKNKVDRIMSNNKWLRFVPMFKDIATAAFASSAYRKIRKANNLGAANEEVKLDEQGNAIEGADKLVSHEGEFKRVENYIKTEDSDYLHSGAGEKVEEVQDADRVEDVKDNLTGLYTDIQAANGDEAKINQIKADFLEENRGVGKESKSITLDNLKNTIDKLAALAIEQHEISAADVDKYLESNLALYDAKINTGLRTKAKVDKIVLAAGRAGLAGAVGVAVGTFFARRGVRAATGVVAGGAVFGALQGMSNAKRNIAEAERAAAISGEKAEEAPADEVSPEEGIANEAEPEAIGLSAEEGVELEEEEPETEEEFSEKVEDSAEKEDEKESVEEVNTKIEELTKLGAELTPEQIDLLQKLVGRKIELVEEAKKAEEEAKALEEAETVDSEENAEKADDFAETDSKKERSALGKLADLYSGKAKFETIASERERKSANDLKDELEKYLDISQDGEDGPEVVKLKEGLSEDDQDALADVIAEIRARNRVSDSANIDLFTYTSFENVDKERDALMNRMIEAKNALFESAIGSAELTDNQRREWREKFDARLEESAAEIEEGLRDENDRISKLKRNAIVRQVVVGAATGALTAFAVSKATEFASNSLSNNAEITLGDNAEASEISASPEDLNDLSFEQGDIDGDGNLDFEFTGANGESISGEVEFDDAGYANVDKFIAEHPEYAGLRIEENFQSGNPVDKISFAEYLQGDHNDVANYANVSFDQQDVGLVRESGVLTPEGYTFRINGEVPEGAQLMVKVGEGQVLTAEIGSDGMVTIPDDSALFNTMKDGWFTGESVGVGKLDGETLTYFSSNNLENGISENLQIPEFPENIEASSGAYSLVWGEGEAAQNIASFEAPDMKLEPTVLENGTEIDATLLRGGYNPAEDAFLNKGADAARSAFANALDTNNAELATEQWLTNMQGSPDQLVWNAVSMRGFQDRMDDIFGDNWQAELGIDGQIDTADEVNTIANKLAENPHLCDKFRSEFMDHFNGLMSGGSVERVEIPSGGRFSTMDQANQFLSSDETDLTGSSVMATKATSGGTGYVYRDANGNDIFDREISNKLLNVPEGQETGDMIIRAECGGQQTKVPLTESDPVAETQVVSDPAEETTPSDPANETTPSDPTNETTPSDPAEETTPSDPTNETTPSDPTNETTPSDPTNETTPTDPQNELTPKDPGAIIRNAGDVTPMGAGDLTDGTNNNGTYNPETRTFETPDDGTITTAPLTNDQTVSQNINTTLSGDGSGNTIADTIQRADQSHAGDQNVTVNPEEQAARQAAEAAQRAADAAATEMKAEGDVLANASAEELAEYVRNRTVNNGNNN